MAIALVQSATGTAATATVNPSFSVAPTNGNLIVLAFASDDYNGTPNTGWTQSTGMEQQTFHGGYIWWRISTGANPPGAYTIGSASNSAWILMEFSGCDASPYDISNGQFVAADATTYTTPSITPTTGNRVLVAMLGGSDLGSQAGRTVTGWTNSFTGIANIGSGGGGTNDMLGTAYRLVTGTGSTAFSTGGTYSASQESRSGLIIAFKEGAAAGTTLTAAGGSYTITGTSAGVAGRAILDAGSYALTGTAATFAFKFTAAGGGYTISGADATFVTAGAPVTLTAEAGSYTLTGTSVGVAGRAILDPGSYALTGTAMTWRLTAPVDAGAYALTGTSATFLRGMTAGNSGYTVNGSDVLFRLTSGDYTLFCDAGAYALTGRDAAFPGNEPLPPVQPSTGGGYTGGAVYDTYRLRKKRKRDEIEELIDAVIQNQAPATPAVPHPAGPSPPALINMTAKMQAVGLTPPQRKVVKRAIVTDDPDDDDEAIELLLNLLS